MRSLLRYFLLSGLILLLFEPNHLFAQTQPVAIVNPDFEILYKAGSTTVKSSPFDIREEAFGSNNLSMTGPTVMFSDNTTGNQFNMAGWTFNTQMGVSNLNDIFAGDSRDMIVWMNGNSFGGGTSEKTMSQILEEDLQQKYTYTLSADFGWRNDNTIPSPPVLRLYAGTTLLTPITSVDPPLVKGGFVTYSRTYYVDDPSVVGDLRIEFGLAANTNGQQLNIDRIRLSKILIHPIAIVNPDFEILYKDGSTTVTSPLLAEFQEVYGPNNLDMTGPTVMFSDNTTGNQFNMAGWTFNTQMGVSNINPLFPSSPRNMVVWMNGNSFGGGTSEKTMSQTLKENFLQKVTYTLTADFGLRSDNIIPSPPVLRLYAGTTLLSPINSADPPLISGDFVTYSRTYYVNDQSVSGPLRIEFGMATNTNGQQLNTDRIRLSKAFLQSVENQITYVSPVNTSTNLETSQELVWEPIVGAMSYVVEVSSNTNFDEAGLIFQSNDYEGTTLSLEDLNNQTTYFWRVRPNMPGPAPELEDWMTDDPWFGRQYRMFRTKMETVTEFSDDSACLSAASGQISWPTSTGAKTYNLQVATNPEMENPVYEYKTLSSNTFTFRRYELGTYYWRVRAQGNSVGGDLANWSEVQSFTVIPSIEVSGSTTFCEGGSVMLTAPAGMGLQWFKDGEAIEGATEAEYTATESGVYHVGLSTEAECDYTSESITVTVDPLPEITFNASTNQVCAGGTATLLVEGAYPAQWYKDGVAIGGNGQNSLVVSESGSYTVEVTGTNGCKLMSDPQVIEILTAPELTVTLQEWSSFTVCEGGFANITIPELDGSGTLIWYKNGVGTSLHTGTIPVNWASGPGTWYYTYTNAAGCTYYSEEYTVTETILPTPEISVTANHQEMLSRGYPVALFSSAAPAGAGYQWVVNGEILTGINGRGIAILGNATVTVSFVTEAGCIANSQTFNVTYPAGVEILNTEVQPFDSNTFRRFTAASGASAEAFQAFPNPTEGVMNVVISKNLVGQATMLSIRSILGTEVMTANLVDDGDNYTASFDLGAMRNGLYVLQVEGSTGVYRKTVKKE
ncbi:T9SS type A sorting domain-containing protein [Fulvivirgaceae bacterium LMO-SS25]